MSVSTVQAAPEILPVPSASTSRPEEAPTDAPGFSSFLRDSSAAGSRFSKPRATGSGTLRGSSNGLRKSQDVSGGEEGLQATQNGDTPIGQPAGDSDEAGILPAVRAESDLPAKEQALTPADAALDAAAMAALAISGETVGVIPPVTRRELGSPQGSDLDGQADHETASSVEPAVHVDLRQSASLATLKGVLRGSDGGVLLQSEVSQRALLAAGASAADSSTPNAAGTPAAVTVSSLASAPVRQTVVAKIIATLKAQPGLAGYPAIPTFGNAATIGSSPQAPVSTGSSAQETKSEAKLAFDPSPDLSVSQAQTIQEGLRLVAQAVTVDPRVAASPAIGAAVGQAESLDSLVNNDFSARLVTPADSQFGGADGEPAATEIGFGGVSVDSAASGGRDDAQAGFTDSGSSQNAGYNADRSDARFAPSSSAGQSNVAGTQGADSSSEMNESALERDLDSVLSSSARDGADAGASDMVVGNFGAGVTFQQGIEPSTAKVQAPGHVNRAEVWDAVRESILKVVSENPSHISVELRLDDGSTVGVELRMGASGLQASFRSESNALLRSLESRWNGFLSGEQADLKVASAVFEGRSSFGSFSDSGRNGRELRQQMEDSADAASLSAGQRALAAARGSASKSSAPKTDSSANNPTLYA